MAFLNPTRRFPLNNLAITCGRPNTPIPFYRNSSNSASYKTRLQLAARLLYYHLQSKYRKFTHQSYGYVGQKQLKNICLEGVYP